MMRRGWIPILAFCALWVPETARSQVTHVVVVSGLGGSPEYTERFRDWGAELVGAAERAGLDGSRILWLAEREDVHPSVDGAARKDRLTAELASLGSRVGPDDVLVIVLFGHGSGRGGEAQLNLPGPDLSAGELAALLAPLDAARTVVVNAASASGGFIAPLSAEGRVVITATRSPAESEATRFGGHFVRALSGGDADTDKDGRVSMLEAWEYTRQEVAREYADAGQLATEHALLDDDGDGVGSMEPGGSDGALAARIALAPVGVTSAPASSEAAADPELRRLLNEKERLETALSDLRSREGSMEAEAYQRELERLLLEIARNGRAIRERQDGGGGDGPTGGTDG